MQKGLFFQPRDLQLFKSVSQQLVQHWMNIQIQYFKLNAQNIKVNIYGQAKKNRKQYYKGITLPSIVDHTEHELDFNESVKYDNDSKFRFLVSTLKKFNLYPEIGDIILWRNLYWQISLVTQQQLIGNNVGSEWSKICHTTSLSDSKVKQLLAFTESGETPPPPTETSSLRPNEDIEIIDQNNNFQYGFYDSYYGCINEDILDVGNYLRSELFLGSINSGIFGFPNVTKSEIINSVTVKAYMASNYNLNTYNVDMYIGGERYSGISENGETFGNTLLSYTWNVNPANNLTWTWDNINDLQVFVELHGILDWGNIYLYQLWVEVEYIL